MSVMDEIRSIAAKIEPYVAFVAVVESATKLGGPATDAALAIIRSGLSSLAAGAAGALTPEQVLADLAKLTNSEAADDAAADAVIAARLAGTLPP